MKIHGERVVDATKPLRITITNRDVRAGRVKKADACAAAVACIRQEHATAAKVYLSRTYLRVKDKKGPKWVRYMTPRSLRGEIIVFDRKGAFAPGDYRLETVQPSLRFGMKPRRYDKSKGPRHGKPSPRSKPHVVSNVRRSPFDPSTKATER